MAGTLYATLAELKKHLGITDTQDDAELTDALAAACRLVDEDTNRVGTGFGVDTVASARVYKPTHAEVLLTDDISTTTGLTVAVGWQSSYSSLDSNAWELRPENAFARGKPANVIARIFGTWPVWYGPVGYLQQRVQVTAVWGWPAVPDPIKRATLLRAARLYRRKGSPEGVAGFGDFGVVRVGRNDPDYEALIAPYIADEM